MAGEGGEAVFGIRLDFNSGNLAEEAAKVQGILNQIGEERTTAQGKGETYDVAERLRGARQGILRQYQGSGGYGKEGQQAVYQMARDMLLSAEKELQRGLKDGAREAMAQSQRLIVPGAGPGGYGGRPRPVEQPATIPPPAPPAKEPEQVRKWRREAEAFQIPEREQLSAGDLGQRVRVYQEATRRGQETGYSPIGRSFEEVQAKLAELKATADATTASTEQLAEAERRLAQAQRQAIENAPEAQQQYRRARAGAMAEGGDQGGPGFLHELLQASVLGIGGYRRFGRLGPGALAGGAAAALPTGLITGGAFTAFYALQQGVAQAVRQAVQLDRQMANVKDTVQALGQGGQFGQMRESLLGISDATGVAGSDVATLAQTFLGLTGNVNDAVTATKSVAQYIEVTGENAQQASTEIATVMQSFQGLTAEQAASAAIAAGRAAGRTPQEISGGVANVAPVASLLGLTANQTYGLVAAASRGSSLDAGQIGQSLSRILEGFQTNIPKLFSEGVNFSQPGNYRQDIIDLVTSLRTLAPANRIAVTESLGGPRNVQALAALGGPQAMAILQGNYTGSGALGGRAAAVSQTTAEAFKRLSQQVETTASDLLNSGLGKALTDAAHAAGLVVHGLGDLATFAGRLNRDMGGVPLRVVELSAGLLILTRLIRGLQGAGGVVATYGGRILRGEPLRKPAEEGAGVGAQKAETTAREANTTALDTHTQALNEDTASLTKNAGAADADAASSTRDAAAKTEDAAATAENAAAQTGGGLLGGSRGLVARGGGAAAEVTTAGEAAGGASLLTRLFGPAGAHSAGAGAAAGEEAVAGLFTAAGLRNLISSGGKFATSGLGRFGIGAGAFLGGQQLVNAGRGPGAGNFAMQAGGRTLQAAGLGYAFGGPTGALFGGAAGVGFEGGTAALDAIFGKPQNVKPSTRLTDSAKTFVKNFKTDYAQALSELRQAATPAQRAELDKAMKEKDNFDLIKIYNQLRGTAAGQRALGANPATEAQAQFQPVAAAYAGAPAITTRHPFQTAQDANAAFQAGVTSWAQNVFAMTQAVNLTLDPVQRFQQSLEEYNIIATHAATVISSATEAAQQAGGTPTAVLGATTQAFGANLSDLQKNPQAVIQAGQGIVQAMGQATDFIIQNTQATGGGAGFGANILGINQGAAISTAQAQDINRARASQGLAAYQFDIQGNQARQILGPQQRQQQVQQYVGIAQAGTQLQVTQAQARQASQAQINQIQTQGDQAVLANLQREQQILGSSVNLQPQILAAATKVAQDQATSTQTDLQNIQSYAQYRSSLDFQRPISQAQDALNAANQGAARLGTSVAALQRRPWASLSTAEQGILSQWAQAQQQMYQAISSATQAQIGLIQASNPANALLAANQSLGAINNQVRQQFGSQGNLQAQAAGGNQGAIALLTQQRTQQFQASQAQLAVSQAQFQTAEAVATGAGNPLAAAEKSLQQANAAVAYWKSLGALPGVSQQLQDAQTQVATAQAAVFNAQIQQAEAISGLRQAQIAGTGNTPAVAAEKLRQAQDDLNRFVRAHPTEANQNNLEFVKYQTAVQQAANDYLEQTISFDETRIGELVATNQISIGQAINQLKIDQAKAAAAGNQAQVLAIQAQIQQYINQGNENASFNLPANLNIPTLYEVRRTEATPSGANYYGNHGTVNVSINIDNKADVQPAVNALMQAVGGPPTTGYVLPY